MIKKDSYAEKCLGALLMAGVGWLVFNIIKDGLTPFQREMFSLNRWPDTDRLTPPTITEQVTAGRLAGKESWTLKEYQRLSRPKYGRATREEIEIAFGRGYEPTLAEYTEVFGEPYNGPFTLPVEPWTADLYIHHNMSRSWAEEAFEVGRRIRALKEKDHAPATSQ